MMMKKPTTKEEALLTGKPVYTRPKDIPEGWQTKTIWASQEFTLRDNAEPVAYKIHGKYVSPLFDACSVEPKVFAIPRVRRRKPPTLRRHSTGCYVVTYRKKNKYLGTNPSTAEKRYQDWLKNVWSRDQMGLPPTQTRREDLWNIPDELAWLANDLREYVAWNYPPCIYFFLRQNNITYVGSSTCLPNRILQHRNEGRKFDRVLWMPVEEERMLELEDLMIGRLQPKENVRSRRAVERSRVSEQEQAGN
ncbi:MAG: GIY-YIG nuclease family protein [Phycisphaerae bacterium]